MRIDAYVTQAWKMLERAEYFPILLQPLQVSLCHFRDLRGGIGIGAFIELRVINVGDIYDRGEIQIKAIRCKISRILDTLRHGLAGIVGCADISGGWPWSIQVYQTVYRSTLLVDCNREWNAAIALHLRNQAFQLCLINNVIVGSINQDSPYIILADHCADIKPVCRPPKLHNHHLPQLLIQRHTLHDQIDILLRG